MERQKASDAPIFISKSDFFASKSDFGPPGGSPGGQFFLDTDDIFKFFQIFSNFFKLFCTQNAKWPVYKLALCNVQHLSALPVT